jgi:hypothetical protein
LEVQQKNLSQQASKIGELKEERQKLLEKIQKEQEGIYLLRKEEYELLSKLSNGKLNISIKKASNKDEYEKALIEICTGSHIRKNDIIQIANAIQPIDFIQLVLEKKTKDICMLTRIEDTTIQKLVDWLLGMDDRKRVLELQYQYLLQDEPMIEYQKEDSNYYKISELSVGQKCTALLIIALIAGNIPVIIDQPEESIDIASVFNDVVSKLRINKLGRQFILTTHNANIAVTADSDLIHVLKATAIKGQIVKNGAIDDSSIKDEVIEHLEGGKEPYLLRGEKYGLL